MKIELLIPGDVVPQHRPRFARTGKFVRTYNSKADNDYRERLYWEVRRRKLTPFNREIPLHVIIRVERRLLKGHTGSTRENALLGLIWPVSRPDLDNYVKQVFDGLNGLLWEDDSQIVKLEATKVYSETPCLYILVSPLASPEQEPKCKAQKSQAVRSEIPDGQDKARRERIEIRELDPTVVDYQVLETAIAYTPTKKVKPIRLRLTPKTLGKIRYATTVHDTKFLPGV